MQLPTPATRSYHSQVPLHQLGPDTPLALARLPPAQVAKLKTKLTAAEPGSRAAQLMQLRLALLEQRHSTVRQELRTAQNNHSEVRGVLVC
jgi:hypothetical protein